jgi:hypothetical protein
MRRVLAATFVLALALALSAPAMAAKPSPKKMAAQIAVLQKQVKTLQKQVKKLNTAVGQTQTVAVVALLYGGCSTAATADALQGGNAAVYGSTPVSDYNACSDLSKFTAPLTVARQPSTATVTVFQSLLSLFKPSGAASTMFARLQH